MPPKKKDDKKEDEVAVKEEVGAFCFADGSKYDGQIVRKGGDVQQQQAAAAAAAAGGVTASTGIVKRQGNGVFIDTCATYDGQWIDDDMTGEGTLNFDSGASYVGSFLHCTFYGTG